MTWDEVKKLGSLYAIGALDQKTAQAVEDFLLEATPEQKSALAEWREVAALLPLSLRQPEVPHNLKSRLMKRIAHNESIAFPRQPSFIAKVLPFRSPHRPSSQRPSWLLVAATIALAFSGAYLAWQNLKLLTKVGDLQRQVGEFISPDTRVISMVGVETPQARAKVIWDTKAQTWKVYISNLPAPPADKDYQLWYVTGSAKINAAVFRTDENGNRELSLSLPPEALNGLVATAVTLEPKGGSQQPTNTNFYLKAAI